MYGSIKDGKSDKSMASILAIKFNVTKVTIYRIWRRGKNAGESNCLATNVDSRMKGSCGRKRDEYDVDDLLQINLRRRTNIRSLAMAMKKSKTTVHRRVKEGVIKSHSNALKPYLSDTNKKARLIFSLSMLDQVNSVDENPLFNGMYNRVHIDEKWFFMSKEFEKYYLHPAKIEPERTCQSKRFIGKIMFLAAVARSRFDLDGTVLFDGKIGIFSFAMKQPAKRNSKNREVGTLETKLVAVNKDVYA